MSRAVIALGTNMGNRADNIHAAVFALGLLPNTVVSAVSRLYDTLPVGYADQPRFLNAAAAVETAMSPRALLGACLGIEAAMGRVRVVKNGPRVVDLDVILYENATISEPELTVPHPELVNRTFVLAPLCDLYNSGFVSDADLAGFPSIFDNLDEKMKQSGIIVYSM